MPPGITTDIYWDCECETDYIHPKSEKYCPLCKTFSDEQPDSIKTEIDYMRSIGLLSES